MTQVALLSRSANLAYLKPMLQALSPQLDITVWPDPRCLDAEVAVCWNSPPGIYAMMPRLKLIHSIAAGVDNVIGEQDIRGLPVCRVIDPRLAQGMLQYVLWAVLYFHRRLNEVLSNQRSRSWKRPTQVAAGQFCVGLMGLGELGGTVAGTLAALGYCVKGWSRTARQVDGIDMCAGPDSFGDFLASTDVLVCLLPLTSATRGILGKTTFDRLPAGAAIVNCGRGEHLVVPDLIAALGSGQLRGAVLDVFTDEPLDARDPLWETPGVVVTPHMATMASFDVVVQQIVENIKRLNGNLPLLNAIDIGLGY